MGNSSRRSFLQQLGGGIAASWFGRVFAKEPPKKPQPGAPKEGQFQFPPGAVMPTRTLGKTGQKVSLVGLGGFHIGLPSSDDEATRLIRYSIDHGVTFMDNCWDYNEGRSEARMGKALEGGYRDKVVLMTKLDGRDHKSAELQLEQSLKRLRTDHIDLVQIHEVIRMEDAEKVFAADGTLAALVAARQAGKCKWIGFTGHKSPAIHLHMLEMAASHGFHFDAVQMPLNVMDPHYDSFQKQVLPVLQKREIAPLAMKPMGSGIILQSHAATPIECLHYSMSLPVSVVITGCDTMGVLQQALYAAYTFKPLEPSAIDALLSRTAQAGKKGEFEHFKTTTRFDGTASHPWWMSTASEAKPG